MEPNQSKIDQPTYSTSEIMKLLGLLDYEGLLLLGKLLNEEKRLYCLADLRLFKEVHESVLAIAKWLENK